MSSEQAVIHYLTAISAFRNWMEQGIISDQELHELTSMATARYGLPKGSIYR